MSNVFYVIETARRTFLTLEEAGAQQLKASEVEEYYNAQKFDSKAEVDTFIELLNTGKTHSLPIRSDWTVEVDSNFLPVNSRRVFVSLIED